MKDKYEALMSGIRRRVSIKELDVLYTDYVLECLGGNKVQAAKVLGIDRRTIQRWGCGEAGRPGRTKAVEAPQNPQGGV